MQQRGTAPLSDFLADLDRLRVQLRPEGAGLRCAAPAGVLTPELVAEIQLRKDDIMRYLRAGNVIGRARRPDLVPLSFGQESLWLLGHLDPADSAYHIPLALRLSGPLRPAALAQALSELVQRHEVLRTTYPARHGRPYQRVGAPVRRALPVADLTGLRDQERTAQILAAAAALRPFDLAADPVLRTSLLRLGSLDHLLLITRHHIASDGWSFSVMADELGELYAAFAGGRAARLPDLAIQYADFAQWQREHAQDPSFQARVERWRRRLDGAPVMSGVAAVPSGDESPEPARATRRPVPADVRQRVQRLARDRGTTEFAVLLAGFGLALASAEGQREVVVGTPASGRGRPELEPLIGCFATMLPLRLRYGGEPGFAQAIAAAHDVVAGALDDQDVPVERIIEAVRPHRHLDLRCPLFSVAFVLQNTPPASLDLPGVGAVAQDPAPVAPKFPLTVTASSQAGALSLLAEFGPTVHPATAGEILDRFLVILDRGSAQPQASCAELARAASASLEPPRPRAALNADATLAGRLESVARQRPDAIAVSGGGVQLTYAALLSRARTLAAALRADAGVTAESLVGVCVEPSAELVIAIAAVCLAGGAYVPLDPDDPPIRHEAVITDAGISALVASARYLDAFAWHDGPVLPVRHARAQSRERAAAAAVMPLNLAYVIYTSGSTGPPKGVMVTHANVTAMFDAADSILSFSGADVWTMTHSSAFDFSVWEMWGALLHGARLEVLPRELTRQPAALLQALGSAQATVLSSTPGAFLALAAAAAAPGAPLPVGLRLVILGGDRCEPAKLSRWFDALGDQHPALVNMYGITETTVHATYHRLSRPDAAAGTGGSPIGEPLPGVRARVAGPDGALTAVGGTGELEIAGTGVARGYLRQPGRTADRFRPASAGGAAGSRAYASGDLVRRLPGGQLDYLGRIDSQIQLRGYRIEPGEIEAALGEHSGIAGAAVTARQDGSRHYLAAYVVPGRAGAGPDADTAREEPGPRRPTAGELRRYLAERLPSYMIPFVFVFIDRLPLTRNGKLDRAALPAPDPAAGTAAAAPRTATERELAALWCDLLGVSSVGVHDNFFELGGDSLLVTRLHARLPDAFGVDLPMQRIYRALDIAGLAEIIDRLPSQISNPAGREPAITRRTDG
jgi:amino acid adenylation domain-containing protein